jgi:hypothetical protein
LPVGPDYLGSVQELHDQWLGLGSAGPRSIQYTRNLCPGIDTRLYRWSNTDQRIGIARNNHSYTGSISYLNLYGSPTGNTAAAVIGSFLNPSDDVCSSYWHTMQWYIPQTYQTYSVKNAAGFPNESACRTPNCAQPYDVWTTHEYVFSFQS